MSPLEAKMAELRARFVADAGKQAAALERLVAAADLEGARGIAHGLAGRAGMFGFEELGSVALRADEAPAAELPGYLEDLVEALRSLAQER